jgi:hypothetical protein
MDRFGDTLLQSHATNQNQHARTRRRRDERHKSRRISIIYSTSLGTPIYDNTRAVLKQRLTTVRDRLQKGGMLEWFERSFGTKDANVAT